VIPVIANMTAAPVPEIAAGEVSANIPPTDSCLNSVYVN
jgi:hypothetical protein